ncbi:MAG TPA: hypothetical protein ENN22_12005 [bacterium]|nr:hypothetical protein [bacterium]
MDGTVALDFEISESQSAILSLNLPIWQSFEGSQLVGNIISISFREEISKVLCHTNKEKKGLNNFANAGDHPTTEAQRT